MAFGIVKKIDNSEGHNFLCLSQNEIPWLNTTTSIELPLIVKSNEPTKSKSETLFFEKNKKSLFFSKNVISNLILWVHWIL